MDNKVVVTFFGLFAAFGVWAAFVASDMRYNAPCEEMKNWTVQNIPSRCFNELKIKE